MIAALHANEPTWSIRQLCATLGVARSSVYYAAVPSDDTELRAAIEAIALEFPRYAYRQVMAELARRGLPVNHKRVLRILREACLLVEVRRYCRATCSRHPFGRFLDDVYQTKRIHSALGSSRRTSSRRPISRGHGFVRVPKCRSTKLGQTSIETESGGRYDREE